MKIIYNNIVPFKGFVAINLFGIIFVRKEYKQYEQTNRFAIVIRHELIHTAQMKELNYVFFYLQYVIEYIIKLFYYFNFYKAYKNISFEREAYSNETNLNYLRDRELFHWHVYIIKNKASQNAPE